MAPGKKKIKKVEVSQVKEKSRFNLFSFDTHDMNYDSEWLSDTIWIIPIKAVFNVLLILEIAQAQLVIIQGYSTSLSMQHDIHKHQAKIISNPEIMKLFIALAVEHTNKYAQVIRNSQVVKRFDDLTKKNFTNNAKIKGIVPSVGMKPEILSKYTAGLVMSIRSTFQTHPIYKSAKVISHYNINDLKSTTLEKLKQISPFPEDFEPAVKFLQSRIEEANPFTLDTEFVETPLYEGLLYEFESTAASEEELETYEEESDLTEEELERLRQVNNEIDGHNKKKK